MATILGRSWRWVTAYLDQLEAGLVARGYASARAADPSARSAILSVVPPAPLTAAHVARELERRGVVCTMPDGYLRFAPHWPNALEEVPRVLDALDDIRA